MYLIDSNLHYSCF